MSAYATSQLASLGRLPEPAVSTTRLSEPGLRESLLEEVLDDLAQRVAAAIARELRTEPEQKPDEWLDSQGAAEYLGLHRDTVRRLAAERAIPAEQDGPRCRLFFRRAALDAWRRTGGRPAHLQTTIPQAA
jgi:excisionase family DNA binding protein